MKYTEKVVGRLKKMAIALDNPIVCWALATLLMLGGQYKVAQWFKDQNLPFKF